MVAMSMGGLKIVGVAVAIGSAMMAEAVYDGTSVKVLTADQVRALKKSGEPFVLEFFSKNCGHCLSFAPEYQKAATALENIIKVVAMEPEKTLMGEEGVRGFPTVKFMALGIDSVEFNGDRTAAAVVDFATAQVASLAKKRLAKSKGGSNKDSGHSAKEVITLTDTDFEKKVAKEGVDEVWFVLFYAPWCGHCKMMMGDWAKAASSLKGKIKVAQVDATENQMLAQHFSIQGFPTIRLFPAGGNRSWANLPRLAVSYGGERKEAAFVDFAMQYASSALKAKQLVSQDQFDEQCAKGVCLIAFLPHILDSKTKARNNLLGTLDAVLRASYSMPVKFFWSQGGDQFDFEEKLRLQFGFPAVVAMNMEKDAYAIHKGTFQQESLRSFITSLMAGKQAVDPLPKMMPKLKKVTEWDGKDAPEPKNDEL